VTDWGGGGSYSASDYYRVDSGIAGDDGNAGTPGVTGATGKADDAITNVGGTNDAEVLNTLVFVYAIDNKVHEGDNVSFNIIRLGDNSTSLTVDWKMASVKSGQTADGNDFGGGSLPSGQVSFDAGGANAMRVDLPVTADGITEPDEKFKIKLTGIHGEDSAGLGTSVFKGKIMDSAGGPTSGDDVLEGTMGKDTINGLGGDDKIHGKGGNDTLKGSGGNDRLFGNGGDDKLYGGSGRDKLFGGGGNDKLHGGSGRDVLDGGKGSDLLDGGGGKDKYVFKDKLGHGVDTIVKFEAGEQLRLDSAVFKHIGAHGTLAAKYFHTGAHAQDGNDHILYQHSTGKVFYDSNGDAAGGRTLFAVIDNTPNLHHDDFFVI